MDPFRLCVALGPMAVYLLVLGAINLGRRPFVVSGARDTAAVGVALSGLVLVGPVELLMPERAVNDFGAPYVWLVLIVGYALCLTLAVLLARPRLVIYNLSAEAVRPLLADVIDTLDSDARWAGTSLVMPNLGVELYVERHPSMRNVTLVASSVGQSYAGWRRLELALKARMRTAESTPHAWGIGLAAAAVLLGGRVGWELVSNAQGVAQGFIDLMRL